MPMLKDSFISVETGLTEDQWSNLLIEGYQEAKKVQYECLNTGTGEVEYSEKPIEAVVVLSKESAKLRKE